MPTINPPAFSYICSIRAREDGRLFKNETYGDFLLQVGIIQAVVINDKETNRFELTAVTQAWFDRNPEQDPRVQKAAPVNRLFKTGAQSLSYSAESPKPAPEAKAPSALEVDLPIRCLLISSENVPTKIGIIRDIFADSAGVEIPAEAKTLKVTKPMFDRTEPPCWRVVNNDDTSFDHVEGFKALLERFDKLDVIVTDPIVETAKTQELAAEVSSEQHEVEPEPEEDPQLQPIRAEFLPAIPQDISHFTLAVDPNLRALMSASFQDLSIRFRFAARARADFLPEIPVDLTHFPLLGDPALRKLFESPYGRLGSSTKPEEPLALPHRIKLEHPFTKDKVQVGDVMFLRNPHPGLWGLFLGLDQNGDRAGVWLAESEKQTIFMVDALEKKWHYVEITNLDYVDWLNLDDATKRALVEKALEIRANPIDPFPPPPAIELEDVSEPGQESSIARYPISTNGSGSVVVSNALEALSENGKAEAAAASAVVGGSDAAAASLPARARKKQIPAVQAASSIAGKPTKLSNERMPPPPARTAQTLSASELRLNEAKAWIESRVLPMIRSARASDDWSALGSKGWQENELTLFYRVCSHYTGSPKRWYESLMALSVEFADSIGGAVSDAELAKIKSQIEARRSAVISEKKTIYDQSAVEAFLSSEMPALIAQIRESKDWGRLAPSVLTADYRTRRLVEEIQGNASMQTFVRRPEFGLSQVELDLIDGKEAIDPIEAAQQFDHILKQVILPILTSCRRKSDYRALEPARLAENPQIVTAINYLTGAPNRFQAFYRDDRMPFVEYERTILSAREFTPSRCEEILEKKLKPLIASCRASDPPNFNALSPFNLKRSVEMIALTRYLTRSSTISASALFRHPRVALTESEIALAYGQTPIEQILEIKSTKWAALLQKCRDQDDFSYLRTSLLRKDRDFAALLNHFSNAGKISVPNILVRFLGVTEEEQRKIVRLTYTGDYCREIIRAKVYPLLLGCLATNNFRPLEFDNLFKDRSIAGMANQILDGRTSVEGLLAHPLVGLTPDEARIIVRANVSENLAKEREQIRNQLIDKVMKLVSARQTTDEPEVRL